MDQELRQEVASHMKSRTDKVLERKSLSRKDINDLTSMLALELITLSLTLRTTPKEVGNVGVMEFTGMSQSDKEWYKRFGDYADALQDLVIDRYFQLSAKSGAN